MAEVGFTAAAAHFRSHHAEAGIPILIDFGALCRLPETGPPGARIKLVLRMKERCAAANAMIHTGTLAVVVLTRKRALGAVLSADVILLRCKGRAPFGFSALVFFDFAHDQDSVEVLCAWARARRAS